jgi:L-glutamine-phosphate cytidylyltransferase
MKAIIIGAGRGERLMPFTEQEPKCFTCIAGKRILDWTLEAFTACGIEDIVFIGGYHIDRVRRYYPHFTFSHNDQWAQNNIMESLMYAEGQMDDAFLCTYSDTLFSPSYVRKLLESDHDITLSLDSDWRNRYASRTEHPTTDAEKVVIEGNHVLCVHRDIDEDEAHGEFTGVAKFTAKGARVLRSHYHGAKEQYVGKPFREAPAFEKAYLIHLLQHMIENGIPIGHVQHCGEYIEIDTVQDCEYAEQNWKPSLTSHAV